VHTASNGQDYYRTNNLCAFDADDSSIDDYDMEDDQAARCQELGLLEVVK